MFDIKELGLILGALSTFNAIIEKLDDAKAIGLVPPCLDFPDGHEKEIKDLLVKVRNEVRKREAH